MNPTVPLPLANLERFYACLCQASGLDFSTKGSLRWYDWLATDQVVRIFLADWQDTERIRGELYPWLLRFPQAVSVLSWQPLAPAVPEILVDAGLEVSLEAWGMELLRPPLAIAQLPEGFRIVELGKGPELGEYARLVGTHLTGHRSLPIIQAFATMLGGGLGHGIRCLAACDPHDRIVATTTLFCDRQADCAGIYHVATLPEYRGQGLAHALVEQAGALAMADGLRQVILQTAKLNARRIYEKIGFRHTLDYQRWTRKES